MASALSAVRQNVGALVGPGRVMVTGVPTGGFSTTGFQCSSLALDEDSYYLNWWLRIYAGTHKDTTREVTAFLKAGGTVTFSPAVTGAIDATDLFELWDPAYKPEEVNAAINRAIAMVETEALEDLLDKTLVVIADTFQYTLPAGFYAVETIIQESSTADVFLLSDTLNPEGWRLAAGPLLCFDQTFVTLTAGRKLRVEGQASPGALTLDASTTKVNLAYLAQQATALLHQARIVSPKDDHSTQMVIAQGMADRERARLRRMPRGRRVP